jgi:CBS-domain-containing membrane protein
MARTPIDQAADLTVADVLHSRCTTFAPSATIGEVREWFADGHGHRLALLADGERFAGSLTPEHVAGDLDPARPVSDVAQAGPTVGPEAAADEGRRVALLTDARRVPVVDGEGRLLGIVAVTTDLQGFCGTH